MSKPEPAARGTGVAARILPAAPLLCFAVSFLVLAAAAAESLPTLTNALDVLRLRPEAATNEYPVSLQGVVTFSEPNIRFAFVQDASGGVGVFWGDSLPPALGQLVSIRGVSGPGLYGSVVQKPVFQVLGPAPFPKPLHPSFDELRAGRADSQWTEVQGTVRSAVTNPLALVLSLQVEGRRLQVTCLDLREPDPEHWVDARVVVRGVAGGLFNAKQQFIAAQMCLSSIDEITILEAPSSDPYSLPITPVISLGHHLSEAIPGQRIHLRGTVTLWLPGQALFMRDNARSIQVRTAQAGSLKPGDQVDVIGFYERGESSLFIEDGSFRRITNGTPIGPLTAGATDLISGNYEDVLATTQARLLEWQHGAGNRTLLLQDSNIVFTARMAGSDVPVETAPGSLVKVTGVCHVNLSPDQNIKSLELIMRSPDDLVLVQKPPFWTARHTLWLAAGTGFVLLLSLAWINLLRRQVRRQTHALKDEIEERKRMELQIEATHKDLLLASRRAGMAEVATSVLHNVGNVLNSVNVSTSVVTDKFRRSKLANLQKAADLIRDHTPDLPQFLVNDPKGKQLPGYLSTLAGHLATEQKEILEELRTLRTNVDHIKEIVAMQQSYGKVSGLLEELSVVDLVEDALRINAISMERHQIRVGREYTPVPPALLDKHKVLQILVNLIRNATYALDEGGQSEKLLTVRVASSGSDMVAISITDNGVGIPMENINRIFGHGFTTRKDGHGYGLHSGALAAREMGGSLQAQSNGPGRGACFTLELPIQHVQV